jgi:drug/metabolite transporter (DMT)-like permease
MSTTPEEVQTPLGTPAGTRPQDGISGHALRGYVFAFSAAIAYAASQVVAREGVSEYDAPLVGTTIALAFGTAGFIVIALRNMSAPVSDFRRGALFFGAAGIFSATGVSGMFLAVERAEVVVVAPISSVHPLFTLLLAAVFLRDLERITPRIVFGGALVVAGVVLISVS